MVCMMGILLMASGCSPEGGTAYSPEKKADPESIKSGKSKVPNDDEAASTGMESMEVKGLDLRMLGKPNTGNDEQQTTFWVHADSGRTDDGLKSTLSNPRAVIYDKDGGEIVLTAKTGEFDPKAETALLSGEVLVKSGEMAFTMNTITWDNKQELAYTDDGVTLTSETADLTADGLVINPNTSGIRMTNPRGTIKLGEFN